jgi:poly-gamma-glutamate synthesis protein (capsule biosynthesis protein)
MWLHGHSSHHVKAVEVYQGKLILYSCGDFLNDYEGISGYEDFRGDLALMYFASLDASTGNLGSLAMTPLQMRRFRLNRVSRADAEWLRDTLSREEEKFGTRVRLEPDQTLSLIHPS